MRMLNKSLTENVYQQLTEDNQSTGNTYKVVITTEIAKGRVEIDGEETYRTANARPIDEIVKEYYTKDQPIVDDWINTGMICYEDEGCTKSVGKLSELQRNQMFEASDKYPDDYWGGVSYDISQKTRVFDMEGNQIAGSKKLEELAKTKDSDFIIYIPTITTPNYVTGPKTVSKDKNKAIKFPTEEEADKYKKDNKITNGIVSNI